MSCYKYWGKIEEIANKLSSYGDLDKYGDSALDNVDIHEFLIYKKTYGKSVVVLIKMTVTDFVKICVFGFVKFSSCECVLHVEKCI